MRLEMKEECRKLLGNIVILCFPCAIKIVESLLLVKINYKLRIPNFPFYLTLLHLLMKK